MKRAREMRRELQLTDQEFKRLSACLDSIEDIATRRRFVGMEDLDEDDLRV